MCGALFRKEMRKCDDEHPLFASALAQNSGTNCQCEPQVRESAKPVGWRAGAISTQRDRRARREFSLVFRQAAGPTRPSAANLATQAISLLCMKMRRFHAIAESE
jgi:hypothetical protein